MWFFKRSATTQDKVVQEQEYQKVKFRLHQDLVDSIDVSRLPDWSQDRLREEMALAAASLAATQRHQLSSEQEDRLTDDLLDETFGLGPLQKFMEDPTVSDILVNGPNSVYVERFGRLENTNVVFADETHLTQIIQRIASAAGRRIDEQSPMVDARLPDGSRVNGVLPPLVSNGPVLSIRRFNQKFTYRELLDNHTMPVAVMDLLHAAVQARLNILISGGTGSGKTTLLNALSQFISPQDRIVTIEDTLELQLLQPHVVSMEVRPPNLENRGEIPLRALVKNSLRMRPDRIIIGEVRGPEALDLVQAMNTGHEGSLATIHANEAKTSLARLELLAAIAGYEIPVEVLRRYIATAIHLLVHLIRLESGERRVARLAEVRGVKNGRFVVRDIFEFRPRMHDVRAADEFYATGYTPRCLPRLLPYSKNLSEKSFVARKL